MLPWIQRTGNIGAAVVLAEHGSGAIQPVVAEPEPAEIIAVRRMLRPCDIALVADRHFECQRSSRYGGQRLRRNYPGAIGGLRQLRPIRADECAGQLKG